MSRPNQPQATPERGAQHDALEVFLGEWKAEGQAYGGPHQDAQNPRGDPTRWTSTHSARWHTGNFFLIQDERAQIGGPFDTLSVLGWDDDAGRYFARTFENHGFYRHYEVTVEAPCGRSAARLNARVLSSATMASARPSLGSGGRTTRGCRCATALRQSCDAQQIAAADVGFVASLLDRRG